jgi:2-(1,2-epoxy-1,2-dihydrophenyl)acetyl-CoA isomerase
MSTKSYNTIEFVISEGVATLTLNRPQSLNSFNAEMFEDIRDALKQVKNNPEVRCLMISGRGRGFCAGQDLSDRNVAPDQQIPDLGASVDNNYNPLIRAIKGLEIPVVCAVNGVAAGAGANLALACDLVLAARSASFIQSFCKLGLVPDSGGTWHLPRLVGHARAMGLTLLGDRLSAEQAEQWGMIWKCVDDDKLSEEANRLARHLASQPTFGLAMIKRAVNASYTNTLDQQLDLERDFMRLGGRSEDYREGVAAFMEKRQPVFKGR